MTRWAKVSTAALVALCTAATSASAQSANIAATANVYQALTVAGARDLAFGNVFPGVDKTVAVTDATSGKFTVQGQASVGVNLTFTLPANLTGPGNLPINNWSAHHHTSDAASGGTSFVPSAANTSATMSGTGELFVYIGARVQPAAGQAAGAYSGTVTMTVAYF